ncbi:MAG: chloride channel protein [Bdellovibrionales bacterium]
MSAADRFQDYVQHLVDRLPRAYAQRLYLQLTDPNNIQNFGLWTAAVLAAVLGVGYAFAFRAVESVATRFLSGEFRYWGFALSPILFVCSWYVVRRFGPEAGGSGIPQILAANEASMKPEGKELTGRLLSLRVVAVKIISSLFCLLGGGAIGREGPTLQISASVFYFFGMRIKKIVPKTDPQTWIVAGAAAGLASAFNTPLGGIVYAIEELQIVNFLRVRMPLISAVIISGLVAQWVLGSYLYLGFPSLQNIGFPFLPWALVVGSISGTMGALFGRTLYGLCMLRLRLTTLTGQALLAAGCGIAMVGMFQVTELASGPGIEVISGLLFKEEPASVWVALVRFFGTIISYLSGAAGGIFSPSLAIGAAIGGLMADWVSTGHNHLVVLLGMIGFLTGVTRTPFTAFILVLEMTDRHSALFPMMMSALIALSAAHLVDRKSFYERMKDRIQ